MYVRLFCALTLLVVVSFALHLVWEFFHVRLYTDYEHLTTLPIWLWATLGDALYTLGAFALVSAFKGGHEWLGRVGMRDCLALVAVGFFLALFVEYKALAFGRWAYLPEMPIIPILNVGLTPVVQMSILLPLSVLVASLLYRRSVRVI